MPEYTLVELAKLADVTPRTIRYYIEQGLLAAPEPEGPKTRYTDVHLARLLAIKRLQAAHLPLAEIRQQLRSVPAEQLTTIAGSGPAPAPGAAIDYIRGVLGTTPAPALQAARSVISPSAMAPVPPGPPPEPQTTRSQWERVSLDPDVELHIRRPLTRANNKRVERLISIARQLFEED